MMVRASAPVFTRIRLRFNLFGSLGLACLLLLGSTTEVLGESPASVPGISKTEPTSGPFVKVQDGFMVPYTMRIPGTDQTVEMIPVPGGKYKMGSPESEADRNEDEGPQIPVVVDPIWVTKTETTWAVYKEYMKLYRIFKEFESSGDRAVTEANEVDAITAPTELYDSTFTYENGERPEQPAVTMTQYSAKQFTKWISLTTGQQYRLPTEAEWEYAARAGTTTAYSWGDSADDIDDYAWYFDNADDGQVEVGQKKPNPFGLHDMHGNVAEWTVNVYTEDGYKQFVSKANSKATDLVTWPKDITSGVVRGGSWEFDAEDLRSASRLASDEEEWKSEDPNFPLSPWWFTTDPARGVGFRIFRSYKPLDKASITKFWEAQAEDVLADVKTRIDGGRGGKGLVDPELPKAIEALEN